MAVAGVVVAVHDQARCDPVHDPGELRPLCPAFGELEHHDSGSFASGASVGIGQPAGASWQMSTSTGPPTRHRSTSSSAMCSSSNQSIPAVRRRRSIEWDPPHASTDTPSRSSASPAARRRGCLRARPSRRRSGRRHPRLPRAGFVVFVVPVDPPQRDGRAAYRVEERSALRVARPPPEVADLEDHLRLVLSRYGNTARSNHWALPWVSPTRSTRITRG